MAKFKPYTEEWLRDLCKDSYSLSEVLRKAGRAPGGDRQNLKKKIQEFEIDTSHFTGQLWSKGKNKEIDSRIKGNEKYSLEEILIENSPVRRNVLRGYIKRHNSIEYKCAFCGNDGHWLDTTISLELDHINGVNNDNRKINLRYLCPNCHATTETYCGRNIGKNNVLKAQK